MPPKLARPTKLRRPKPAQLSQPGAARSTSSRPRSVWYLGFYSLLGIILVGKVITTMYQTSLAVSHSYELSAVQTQKQQLLRQEAHLKKELASQTSLMQVAGSQLVDHYQPISQLIVIPDTQALADRGW